MSRNFEDHNKAIARLYAIALRMMEEKNVLGSEIFDCAHRINSVFLDEVTFENWIAQLKHELSLANAHVFYLQKEVEKLNKVIENVGTGEAKV